MDNRKSGAAFDRMARRGVILGGLLGLSVASNAALAVSVATQRQTILVPTLTDSFRVGAGGRVERDYLLQLSRDAAYVFLNRTPESARYFEREVERIAEPDTYQAIKSQLIADRQEREKSRSSQAFYPAEWLARTGELYVEVRGRLDTTNGVEVLESQEKTYALTWSKHGAMLRLKSFVELDRDKAKISQARVSQKENEL